MKRIEPSREWWCTIESRNDRRLAVSRLPYLARPVLTNPQWRLWTLVRPRDWQWAPIVRSGASFRPTFVKETCVEASREPSTECVRGWLALSASRSSLLQVNLFFFFSFFFFFFSYSPFSPLLSFPSPSATASAPPRADARLCERQRQNSSLMGRLWLEDIRVLFFRTSPWESRASLPG